MKMNVWTLGWVVIGGGAWLLAGCSDNIDSYTSAVPPVGKVVYYIAGTVGDQHGDGVSGVEVKSGGHTTTTDADGAYALAVTTRGGLTVTFGRSGYLPQSVSLAIPAAAEAYSEVPLSTTLVAASTVAITPSATATTYIVATSDGTLAEAAMRPEATAPADEAIVGIDLPAGATDRSLTVTYCTDPVAVTAAEPGDIGMALGGVDISPDVARFADDARVLLTLTNPVPGASFADLTLTNTSTAEAVTVAYDTATAGYAAEVAHFSRWAFLAPAVVAFAPMATSGSLEVDNSDNPQAVRGREISYPVVSGWSVESCTPAAMEAVLTRLIANYKGFRPGVVTLTRTRTVDVAATSCLRFTYTQHARTERYTFTFADGSQATVAVVQYLDLATAFASVDLAGDARR